MDRTRHIHGGGFAARLAETGKRLMKIENIHIDGFGVWNEKDWDQLAPGLNVFHGPNEKGKSTLMAFVRSILFGFDRRGSARRDRKSVV